MRTTRKAMKTRFESMEPARIAMETGTASRWVSELLREWGPPGHRGRRTQAPHDLRQREQDRPTRRGGFGAGVGPITALAYLLTIEDPHRFAKSRQVGSFFGLQPRRDQSGEHDPELPITKCGNGMVRRLLVQAAHYILGPFGPDCDLRRFGTRLAERGGKRAKKRAVVAVARKLSVLLHRLWSTPC